jgi:lipoprotein-anchoring transpeptidase ErfK/SrfK
MKIIRNKKTGEILQVSEGDLAKYGLGGQTHSSKGKKVLRSFQQGGIRDYLFSKGVDGSKANRTKLFNKYFDGKYTGTAEQNIKLLSDIKSGKIKINGNINPWTNTGAKADTKKQTPIKVNPWSNIGERAQAEQIGQKAKTNIASTAFKVPAKTAIKVNPWFNAGAKAQPFKKSPELESGVIVDKRTGQAYTIKDKKVAYNFPVLTGQNVESNENLKSLPSQMTDVDKATPIGSYIMNNNISTINKDYYKGLIKNLSPVPAYGMSAPLAKSLAIHQTYNPEVRNALYNTINPYASYGCVNCKPEDIKKLIGDFPQSDTMRVIDSKMPEGREILDQYNIKPKPGFYQGGGGYTDKTGSHFNIKNFFNQNNQTSLNDCPIGYKWSVADQQCLPDEQAIASNFSGDRNKFITGTINQNGEKVGGTNAQPTMSHQPNASDNNYINNSDMNLKRVFGTPNIPAILASNLLLSGLSAFGNNVEEGRQKASAMNQMNNPAFNQTYSYAQPDYGADPYEQTGQKRKTIFKIGGKFRELQGGGGFNAYDFLYGDDEDTTQKKSNDTTKNKKRVTESEVDDSQAQLEAIGLSDMDILNMPSPIRRNISSEEYSPDSSSNYSSQGSNNYGELYLQHQQGATGIRLIKQAAEQGLDAVPRSWSKENIQSNMRNNVSGDFKGPVTPAKFLEYWNGKMNRHMAKVANKETPYDSIFQKVGQEEGINPLFLKAVANIESGINPNNNTKSKYKGITALNYNTYGKKVFDPYFSLSTTAKSFKQEGGTYSTEDISKLPSNFAIGGTFELNESDIQRLIKQGYKIDRL